VSQLAADLKERATAARPVLTDLANVLRARMEAIGVASDASSRMATLRRYALHRR
jgi:hypothetical protein